MRELDLFYNTYNLQGKELKERKMRAGSQNRIILDFFRKFPNESFTPFNIKNNLFHKLNNAPITSIRRAMTCLTDLGYLVMTNKMKEGEYGEKNHTWRLF
jgi:Fe2+ or Zn2+ uptake regulation protein